MPNCICDDRKSELENARHVHEMWQRGSFSMAPASLRGPCLPTSLSILTSEVVFPVGLIIMTCFQLRLVSERSSVCSCDIVAVRTRCIHLLSMPCSITTLFCYVLAKLHHASYGVRLVNI